MDQKYQHKAKYCYAKCKFRQAAFAYYVIKIDLLQGETVILSKFD